MTTRITHGLRPNLSILDGVRGLAALYVVCHHAFGMLWQGPQPGQAGPLGAAADVLSQAFAAGPPAVVLFFLVSGFCIHYRQARSLNVSIVVPAQFSFRSFIGRRLRRLYPPLLAALAITALFDYLGTVVNAQAYGGQSYSVGTIVANLLFQADLGFPVFGTNDPLWSLSYEFWFYMFYPALLLTTKRWGGLAMLALVGSISVGALTTSHLRQAPVPAWVLQVLVSWSVWAAGAFIAEVYVGRVRLPGLRLLGPAGAVGIVALAVFAPYTVGMHGQARDLVWGAAFGLTLTWMLMALPPRLVPCLEAAGARVAGLGAISYSLYLVHMPALYFVAAVWLATIGPLPTGIELAVGGVVLALGLGRVSWLLVERRFVGSRGQTERVARSPAVSSAIGGLALLAADSATIPRLASSMPRTRP